MRTVLPRSEQSRGIASNGDEASRRLENDESDYENDDIDYYEDECIEEIPSDPKDLSHALARDLLCLAKSERETWERNNVPVLPTFSCPYFKAEPRENLDCLRVCDLRSTKEVKQHIWRAHKQPPYCPSCFASFGQARDRDNHIRNRSCKRKKVSLVKGVSERQRSLLSKATSARLLPEDQWFRMWDVVFPKRPRPASPYLQDGLGALVSRVCLFWDFNGQRITAGFLQQHQLLSHDRKISEGDWTALHSYVLRGLVDACFLEFGHRS